MKGLTILLGLVCFGVLMPMLGDSINQERTLLDAESKCIKTLINAGIERSSIWVSQGNCGVKVLEEK